MVYNHMTLYVSNPCLIAFLLGPQHMIYNRIKFQCPVTLTSVNISPSLHVSPSAILPLLIAGN